MTVNVARRRSRAARNAESPALEPLVIGELEQTVFSCPGCTRPLALGARRCPGCGTRLIMGVEFKRVSVFVGLGLVAGFAVGGALTATSFLLDQSARDAWVAEAAVAAAIADGTIAPASAAPIENGGTGGSTGSGSGAGTGVSALTRSAIGQAAEIDARLVTSAVALETALAAPDFDTVAVSQLLRTMSADAVYGLQLTTHIGAWPGGRTLSGDLAAFYAAIQETAGEGLTASIRNEDAYRAAAAAMLQLLTVLDEVDGGVRAAASQAGIALP